MVQTIAYLRVSTSDQDLEKNKSAILHLANEHELLPDNSMAGAERWAAGMRVPAYAIDDETALKVTDGNVEVAPEGQWKRFTP